MLPRALIVLIAFAAPLHAQDKASLADALKQPILPAGQALKEVQKYLEARVPRLPEFKDKEAWDTYAANLRREILDKVVYRGEAAKWRDAKTDVVWFDHEPGGPGYRIRKLRYEALPGLWIPALLYEPEKMQGKVPATLNVMGHDRGGKDVDYQQIRCINLAKRGMLALNVEWFNFGQLNAPGYHHGRMNQLDLCGTSGLAPFYLALKRGLDVLLGHPQADKERVAVSGLSGGGWQTIILSALDTRVTLSNPVAGYSSFLTRINHHKDLGDSEQTPCDLAKFADYTHLTAMLAPRPALLTYNAKDECCFESGYALPPLMEAAGPFFRLHAKGPALRSHVNHVPGTHNYERENREAFYRMVGDFFYPGDKDYPLLEIAVDQEVRKAPDLRVPMPDKNHDFQSIALELSKNLPRDPRLPESGAEAKAWRPRKQDVLKRLVGYRVYQVKPETAAKITREGIEIISWRLALGADWTVPVQEFAPAQPKGTVLILTEKGRGMTEAEVRKVLEDGQRALVVDPFYIGESALGPRAYLFGLLAAAVGERPLGIQASQIAAVARWSRQQHETPLKIRALDEASSLVALTAGGLEEKAVGGLELRKCHASLKEVIEQNMIYQTRPEMFCFGLLEEFDIPQLKALARTK